MKIVSWVILGLMILFFSIILFPWFELLILGILLLLIASYWHYWRNHATYGPYLYYGSNPASSMWVNFIIVSSAEMVLKEAYFCELSISDTFPSSSIIPFSSKNIIDEAGRTYLHFYFQNLTPNTRYYYRIGNLVKFVVKGRSYCFQTISNPISVSESNKARFIIYGDDQTADFFPILAQITNHYQYAAHPDFIIHLGDINQNLWHDQENNAFFQTKRKIFRQIPYLPVVGNHDAKPISRYDAIYNLPHWYVLDINPKLRILCLSGFDGFKPQTNGQYEFIETQLRTGVEENRFILVCIHEYFYGIETNIPEETPTLELREYILPLLKQYNRGFQRNILIFSGHIHEYSRIVQDDLTFIIEGACSNAKWYSKLQDNASHIYTPEIAAKEYGRQSFAFLIHDENIIKVEIRGWGKKIIETLEFRL
jgi:predicted phosphodiesterase